MEASGGWPGISEFRRRCGAVQSGMEVEFRVWAPHVPRMQLVLDPGPGERAVPMRTEPDGFHRCVEADIPDGQRYVFEFADGRRRADPCSLFQPDGVNGPSAVVLPNQFVWTDHDWMGLSRSELAIYELHVGTFTPEGTFEAIRARLAALKELGITAVEIMPIGQFPGERNWGYDGVFLYAAQNSYGGPHGLQRLIDACHAHGLAVILDVVYNHLGPEGNYLREFGPYFTDRYQTPWGSAMNLDGADSEPVRDFFLDNARMWLDEFRVDGLRLDAVHAIFDLSARPFLAAVRNAAEVVAGRTGRTKLVIAESDLNDPRIVQPREVGGLGLDAQWADDFHHAVHAVLTRERQGYYADFGEVRHVADVLRSPFLNAGEYSRSRRRKHGAPATGLAPDQFVACVQNHDQVGNRARGDRLSTLVSPAQLRLSACLMLLSPCTPLLFMGEEYGETRPFPFFCSFDDAGLVAAVREGRAREFAEFAWQGEVPDPQAPGTFASAKLAWSWPEGSFGARLRQLYRDLLALRRERAPLRERKLTDVRLTSDPEFGPIVWWNFAQDNQQLRILANLCDEPQTYPRGVAETLVLSSEEERYSGSGILEGTLQPWECRVVTDSPGR